LFINSRIKAILIYLFLFVVGLIPCGWVLTPIKNSNGSFEYLNNNFKMDYLLLVADSYTLNKDWDLAINRIDSLGKTALDVISLLADEIPPSDPSHNSIISIEQFYSAEEEVLIVTFTPISPTQSVAKYIWIPTVPDTYTLHKGETPYCLARRFDIDINAILGVNGLRGTSVYTQEMKLIIPKDAEPFKGERALHSHPAEYTVLSGDTFYKIACYFGDVYPEEIAYINSMSLDDSLVPETVLQIP
jgi:LysM repeat protein